MRVIQLVTHIDDEASGPSYSVPSLCRELAEAGVEVELHVTRGSVPREMPFSCYSHGEWPWPPKIGISPSMHRALKERVECTDIIHSHSLWCMTNLYPGLVARGKRCRLVISPRGTLSTWALRRSYWRKRLVWWAAQRRVVKASHCFHATSESELRDIRRLGFRQPVAVIPNGVDIDSEIGDYERPSRRQLLFLGRIHPIKGIDILLEAWRDLQDEAPDWELRIVGPDYEGYLSHFKDIAFRLGVKRVSFEGPVFGNDKTRVFRQADLYVLPTYTENFGITVAESLAHGVPVIVTRGAPWKDIESNGCGWWIEIGKTPLIECLRKAFRLSAEELKSRGNRGRQWMERDFGWPRVGRMMKETYTWLLEGGTPPHYVDTI
ncbi:MAG: glycosyltransferase [Deltaproteobacteria bacterium]|nr:glycosyltransferase [Deltaproteobacteria bacterium]